MTSRCSLLTASAIIERTAVGAGREGNMGGRTREVIESKGEKAGMRMHKGDDSSSSSRGSTVYEICNEIHFARFHIFMQAHPTRGQIVSVSPGTAPLNATCACVSAHI